MYIIEAERRNHKWVSGIFSDEQKAIEYYDSIPEKLQQYCELILIEQSEYPLYIIENGGYSYLSLEELIHKLDTVESIENDVDKVYFTIYFVSRDYQARQIGQDEMGSIPHDHINHDFLKWYRQEGVAFLKRRRLLVGTSGGKS